MKRIILCADGTGNKGGYTPDSNVYKIYNAIKTHKLDADDSRENQTVYYNDGIGTAKNKIWRAVTGAAGFGFKRNVCDLYAVLAQNYQPTGENHAEADEVFLFGFSRGAATTCALTGFIHTCGLLDGRKLTEEALRNRVKDEFKRYTKLGKQNKTDSKPVLGKSHGAIPIKFLGLWDTVSALGFPKRTDTTGIFSLLLNGLFETMDYISDKIWSHNFYNYALTDNVDHAYQALAIDDARTSFWPLVWDETERKAGSVEQAWFAGVHSNVGGGYERQGLANIVLDWMMIRAQAHGLIFKDGIHQQVKADRHVHDRLYNSRDGLAVFYRFHPRQITELHQLSSGDKEIGPIKVHDSVIERMARKTANYAPTHLPAQFSVVRSKLDATSEVGECVMEVDIGTNQDWEDARSSVETNILWRKRSYMAMLISTLFILTSALYFRFSSTPDPDIWKGFHGYIAKTLDYILPDFFRGLLEVTIVQTPIWFWGALAFYILLFIINEKVFRKGTQTAAVGLRRQLLNQLEKSGVATLVGKSSNK